MAISTVFYVAWINFGLLRIKAKNINVTVGILALGIGTGVSALLGASALLGQLATVRHGLWKQRHQIGQTLLQIEAAVHVLA